MPKHLQQVYNYHSKPIRVLPGVTPWFVAQDLVEALGFSWQGSIRMARLTGVAKRSLGFGLARTV